MKKSPSYWRTKGFAQGGDYIMDANTVIAVCALLTVVMGMINMSNKKKKK
ncbi:MULTISPECIES: hypothetical protein [unclassified Bacillus (in: firmicutes)]|nr:MULTISPECIES: hypothetical protein [unclassified Bacillus (in: firmicutes)]